MTCAIEGCYQPASWSAWWELWLCWGHLEAVDRGDWERFCTDPGDLISVWFWLDPDQPFDQQIAARLRAVAP